MLKAVLPVLLLSLLAALLVHADIPAHRITSLPGFSGPFPSAQYSGYITINQQTGKALHYWLVLSENNPANDPLVLWMNGGPGCSSLGGFFYEQGPLHFVDPDGDSDDVPQLELNPYRWNKNASVIFLEAPAGVGFSYSNTSSDYNTNDNKTAIDNYTFLVNFFQAYPELAKNRFFVSGESYAGIYVPTLVYQIMIHNQAGQSNINLEGFLVGNGCTGNAVGICSPLGQQISIDFLHGHGLFSEKLYQQIVKACPDPSSPSAQCYELLVEMGNQVGDVNIYDVYTPCINGGGARAAQRARERAVRRARASNSSIARAFEAGRWSTSQARRIPLRGVVDAILAPEGPDECIDGIAAAAYLNDPTVRQAIHVLDQNTIGTWSVCTSNINYDSNTESLLGIYPTLIKNYRTLIYNGDVDACVPYLDNEQWTSGLGIPVSKGWHQWLLNNQVAGYATNYQLNDFTFVTVKGAGHMVPQFKPAEALEMLNRFLNKQPF